jgi:mycothiol synthase
MSLVARGREVGPRGVHLGWAVALECQGDPVTSLRRRPAGLEGSNRVLGVKGESDRSSEAGVHVGLVVGVRRDIQSQATVKGDGGGHVGHDYLDQGGAQVHTGNAIDGARDGLGRFGHDKSSAPGLRIEQATGAMASIELRPIQPRDVEEICALVNQAEKYDGVPRALSIHELRQDLEAPFVELAHDTRIATHEGQLAGWSSVWNPPAMERQDRAFLFGEVLPDHRAHGVGRALLGWAVQRATARLRDRDHGFPRCIRVAAFDWIAERHRLYARLGFTPVRWFDELLRPLTQLPAVDVPSGIVLTPWPDDRDDETLAVRNEAFNDHWGSAPFDSDTWHLNVRGHGARLDLSVVAVSAATGNIVGVCLNHAYPEDDDLTGRREAWISHLATLRTQRGRGLATAMIGWSLAAFEADGFTHAAIDVDADNPTGAARLYRNLGFEPLRRSIMYQIEVN